MEKITKLLSAKVVTSDGKVLGRVVDVRSAGDPEHGVEHKSRPITDILYRPRGLPLFRPRSPRILSWDGVEKYSRGKIVLKPD